MSIIRKKNYAAAATAATRAAVAATAKGNSRCKKLIVLKPIHSNQQSRGARSIRDGDTGNEDDSSFAAFLNLTTSTLCVKLCHDKPL